MVELRGIKVVVLDMDDTLFPESQFVAGGFAAVAAALSPVFGDAEATRAKLVNFYETGDKRRVFDALLTERFGSVDRDLVRRMVEAYRLHTPQLTLRPDAERLLNRITGRFHTALISDGPLAMQRNKVAALGLEKRLDEIVLTDQWGRDYWKPHPRAFEHVSAKFACRGRELVYIADNPAKDFVSPRVFDWHAVQVCREDGVYASVAAADGGAAEVVITSLDELVIEA